MLDVRSVDDNVVERSKVCVLAGIIVVALLLFSGCTSQSSEESYIKCLEAPTQDDMKREMRDLLFNVKGKEGNDQSWRQLFNSEEVADATYESVYKHSLSGDLEFAKSFLDAVGSDIRGCKAAEAVVDGVAKGFAELKDSDLNLAYSLLQDYIMLDSFDSNLRDIGYSLGYCRIGITEEEVKKIAGQDEPTAISQDMGGYYADPKHQHEDFVENNISDYEEGFGSALEDVYEAESWCYYGDFAIKTREVGRDSLSNKEGEPPEFHFETDVTCYYKDSPVNLTEKELKMLAYYPASGCYRMNNKLYSPEGWRMPILIEEGK